MAPGILPAFASLYTCAGVMPSIFATKQALIGPSCLANHSSHFIVVNTVNIVAFRPVDRNLLELIASYTTDTAASAQLGTRMTNENKQSASIGDLAAVSY